MELGARGALDAMVGPKGLGTIGRLDFGKGGGTGMITGKGCMVLRVPVLGQDDGLELAGQLSHAWNDLVASWHLQHATGNEVVLDVDDQQGVGFGVDGGEHGCLLVACLGYFIAFCEEVNIQAKILVTT